MQRNKLNLGPLESLFVDRDRPLERLMNRVFLLILIASTAAFAAETGLQQSDPTPSESVTAGRSANDVLNVLARRLSLSEDQKSKILPIIEERRRKVQEVWATSELF